MITEIEITNQPASGLRRKVAIARLLITGEAVAFSATIQHYANDGGAYGAHIPDLDIQFEKDTRDSWIDLNTGAYARPLDPNAFPLEFEPGVNAEPEINVLQSTQIWAGILYLLGQTIANVDARAGLEGVKIR